MGAVTFSGEARTILTMIPRLKTTGLAAILLLALAGAPASTLGEQAGATTVGASPLAADTIWSGRVTVRVLLEVPAGVTLTALPGTEIAFETGAGLIVPGTLIAEGTTARPVVFTATAVGAPRGDWAGITFLGAGGGSLLRHCRILGAAAVSIMAGAHTVEDCEITGGTRGLVVSGKSARPLLSRNRLADLSAGGVDCRSGSAPRVLENTIERCGPFGVATSRGSDAEIRGNTIVACASGVELSHSEPAISDNVIRGCERGIALSYAGSDWPVQGNRLEGNGIGIAVQQFSAPEIRGNIVAGGRQGVLCFKGAHPLITGNTIRNAEVGIACDQLADPLIDGNSIENNGTGITLNLSSYATIRRNNLVDNRVQMALGNMSLDWERRVGKKPSRGRMRQHLQRVEQGQDIPRQIAGDGFDADTGMIDARDNWWGEETTREMAAKGPDADILALVDGHDAPTRRYEGFEGEYAQDRITYAPWSPQPFVLSAAPAER